MKKIFCITLVFALWATVVSAGVLSVVSNLPGATELWVGAGALVLAYIFKQIPNTIFKNAVFKFFRGVGVTATLGMSRWKITKPFWNKIVEPWVIDLIDNTVGAAVAGLVEGLRSDNADV